MIRDGDKTSTPTIDPARFRQVLGNYPTGVCVITSRGPDGSPVAMVVGTFTSVSLDPPLIGFLPANSSTTWPVIRASGRFCVNIMAADQEDLCRRIAIKSEDRFVNLAPDGPAGAPRLNGAVGWIDCTLSDVHPAGDHVFAMGEVLALDTPGEPSPLIFYRGGYGGFSAGPLIARDSANRLGQGLRLSGFARTALESLADAVSGQSLLSGLVESDVVFLAQSDRRGARSSGPQVQLGQRVQYLPPSGAVFAAWSGLEHQAAWLAKTPADASADDMRRMLRDVRDRGVSYGLASAAQQDYVAALDRAARQPGSSQDPLKATVEQLAFDPPGEDKAFWTQVRQISSPIIGPDGHCAYALTVFNFAPPASHEAFSAAVGQVKHHAAQISGILEKF